VTDQGHRRRAIGSAARSAIRRAERRLPFAPTDRIGLGRAVAIGVFVGALSIGAKSVLNTALAGETGFVALIGAVAIAAWWGGLIGGLTASVTAGIVNLVVFVAPQGDPGLAPLDIARTVLYLGAGTVVTLVIASLTTARDRLATSLTEIGTMAADLERRDERLEMVLAASGTGFWEWDIPTGSLVWSDAIYAQHGLDPGTTSPTYATYVESVHPDDRAALDRAVAAALESGTGFDLEFRVLWPDGSIHWVHGVGRVFRDLAGAPIRVVGTGTDITERRRLTAERDTLLEEERRAGAFREAFIDVISHELRTPITTILGLTQILARPHRNEPGTSDRELIDDINAESERLHRLVEDLLVLTRAERGPVDVEDEPLALRRVLTRVVERETPRLPGLTISLDVPRELPIVAGEEIYVEQIVRNMLTNAAKYTPAGTHVVVAAEPRGDTVAVRVLDDGPGMDASTAERAFELFYRDPETARNVAGSGIGLFVCASLVEAMGGTIWARPRPEGGSEFGFSLLVLFDDESSAERHEEVAARR